MAGPKVIARGETSRPRHRLAAGSACGFVPAASDRCLRRSPKKLPLIVAPPRAFGGDFDRCWLLGGPALWRPLGAQLGDRGFHRPRGLIELAAPIWGGRRRPQSAARAVRRPARRLQPLFAEQPAVSQRALYRRRKASGISPGAYAGSSDAHRAAAGERYRRLCRRRRTEMAGAAIGVRRLQGQSRSRAPRRISNNFAPSARRCCRASPASRCCGTNSTSPGGNGRRSGSSQTMPDAPDCATGADAAEIEFVEFVQWTADRQLQACRRSCAPARHEGRALSRCRGRRAIRTVSMPGTSRRRFRAISRVGAPPDPLEYRRPGLGPRGLQRRRSRDPDRSSRIREMLRASMRHAGAIRLDHVLGLKRLYLVPHGFGRRQRRLCADAVRGAAGGDRAGKRGASLRRDRRGPRHRAGGLSRADGRLGHLVVSGDDVRARRSRLVPRHRPLLGRTRSSPSTPTISRPMPAGARFSDLEAEALARHRSRRKRRCALACAWPCWTTCCVITPSTATISIPSLSFPGADQVPAARDLAGGSVGRARPAQHSRHRRRASELAAAAAGVDRADCFRRSTSPRSRRATRERSRAAS